MTALACWLSGGADPAAAQYLRSLTVVLAAALAAAFLSARFRQSALLGYLAAGILLGPNALALVPAGGHIDVLAEVGVVLLMFTIGMEFSPTRLRQLGRTVAVGGTLQVVATMAMVGVIAHVGLGMELKGALTAGAALAMTSTAIMFALLRDRGETDTAHGRLAIGVSVVQDVLFPALLLTLDAVGQKEGSLVANVAVALGRALLLLTGMALASRVVLPRLLRAAAQTGQNDLFVLMAIAACLGVAWLGAALGLGLALGAFVAGVVLGSSEYSHQVTADLLPFRAVFFAIFFVSIGMLLDLSVVANRAVDVGLLAAGALTGGTLLGAAALRLGGASLRVALQAGLVVAPAGEFSFVLLGLGLKQGSISADTYQTMLAACVVTMLAAPVLHALGPRLGEWISRLRLGAVDHEAALVRLAAPVRKDHVIICGYGPVGQLLASVLRHCEIPHVVLELNGRAVEAARAEGVPIVYGDATRRDILLATGIREARVLAVAVPDPAAARAIVRTARDCTDRGLILVRTKFMAEVDVLYRLGATEVVEEERETALEMLARSLRAFAIPRDVVERELTHIRAEGYAAADVLGHRPRSLGDITQVLRGIGAEVFSVAAESRAAGHALWELDWRRRTGASVLAVVRRSVVHANPGGDFTLATGDLVVATGAPPHLMALRRELTDAAPADEDAPADGAPPADLR